MAIAENDAPVEVVCACGARCDGEVCECKPMCFAPRPWALTPWRP